MSLVLLTSSVGHLLDNMALSIAGNYEVLSIFILILVFGLSYLFGREIFALLATSLVAVGMGVWNSDINRLLIALVAVVFGVLIVMLVYRVTNK